MHVRGERVARQHRMNIGTIVEAPLVKVRLVGKRRVGPLLGEIEEYFVNLLRPGDTFMFAGRLLRFLRLHENVVECAEGGTGEPMVPAYEGGRLPLTTNLADRVRGLLQTPSSWNLFPDGVQEWLRLQQARSRMPGRSDLLVETFPRGDRWYLVAYCFEGRNAHQTLGMLLTRRMERAGYAPLGFVATDYVLGVWSAEQPRDVGKLFDQDMLGDDLETWLAESSMLRRTFRNVAVIAGLIERHHPGAEKTRKQVTVNSDLIYDVLRRHQPDHILLRATRADAAGGLTDLSRIAGMLARVKGRIVHMVLSRVSPLAVPVLLEIGRESVRSDADEEKLLAEAEAIIAEATGEAEPPGRAGAAPVRAIHRPNVIAPAARAGVAVSIMRALLDPSPNRLPQGEGEQVHWFSPSSCGRRFGRGVTALSRHDRSPGSSRRRTADAGSRRRALLACDQTAGSVGSSPRKRLVLRPARSAAAALGHACDTGPADSCWCAVTSRK